MVFTGYAINSAAICFALTLALILCDENSTSFDKFIKVISGYINLLFGPMLLTFCLMGMFNVSGIMHECSLDRIETSHWNMTDLFVLMICTIMSISIVCLYTMDISSK